MRPAMMMTTWATAHASASAAGWSRVAGESLGGFGVVVLSKGAPCVAPVIKRDRMDGVSQGSDEELWM